MSNTMCGCAFAVEGSMENDPIRHGRVVSLVGSDVI